MSQHHRRSPPRAPGSGSSGLKDLTKQGLSITFLGGLIYGALIIGQTWGQYQERGANMQQQLTELKADVREIKNMVLQIRDRPPQWKMEVRR